MIKIFESFTDLYNPLIGNHFNEQVNEVDPYGEEDWDDFDFNTRFRVKNIVDVVNMNGVEVKITPDDIIELHPAHFKDRWNEGAPRGEYYMFSEKAPGGFFTLTRDEFEVVDNFEFKYKNYYKCDKCGQEWEDMWDSTCDDECPNCGTEMTPYESEDINENVSFEGPIDPYGEEDWEYDNLPPVLQLARKQNIPHDQISKLNCFNNQLTSLEGIENLVNLERLYCYKNQLTSLEGIENLVNLKYLDCSLNQLTSLDGIENLINLEGLDCCNNQLTSLDGIENIVNLKGLYCSHNQLTSLDGIENLVNLEGLYCSNNQLTSLEGIENLVNLKGLSCRDNQFSNDYKEYLEKYCRKNNITILTI
jgi:hypothetical protein